MKSHALASIFALIIILLCVNEVRAQGCIMANDFGSGANVRVAANPAEQYWESTLQLVKDTPKNAQIAPWIPTPLYSLGYGGTSFDIIIMGRWYPYGGKEKDDLGVATNIPLCKMHACNQAVSEDATCIPGGNKVTMDIETNYPCYLAGGDGLYGLIALTQPDGSQKDPNRLDNAISLTSNYFRTFHAKTTGTNADGYPFLRVEYTMKCTSTGCVKDVDASGKPYIPAGKIFFKILDSYYMDNSGAYDVTILSGVKQEAGVIEITLNVIKSTLEAVTRNIFQTVTKDFKFRNIVRAMLILYILIGGLMFALGLIKAHQSELVMRSLKISLMVMLISDSSWQFFNEYLFSLFIDGAQSIAAIVVSATVYTNNPDVQPLLVATADASDENGMILSIFDQFLRIYTSKSVAYKILANLFYKYNFYYIFLIYLAIFFILIGLLMAVSIYIMTIVQLAILCVIAPICIIMILFKVTKHIFDTWLKNMLSSAILMVLVLSTTAFFLMMLLSMTYVLLKYQVCWSGPLILFGEDWTDIFDLWFWYPSDPTQIDAALTIGHYLQFLVVALLFKIFVSKMPELADGLSNTYLGGSSASFSGMMNGFYGGVLPVLTWATATISPLGMARDMASDKIDDSVRRSPILSTTVGVGGAVSNFINKTAPGAIFGDNVTLTNFVDSATQGSQINTKSSLYGSPLTNVAQSAAEKYRQEKEKKSNKYEEKNIDLDNPPDKGGG